MATFDAACQRHWPATLLNRSLDTMDLTLHLERDGAFAGRPPIRRFTLDGLCEMFGVIPHDCHTANRRCLHHRAGLPAAGAPGSEGKPTLVASEPFPIPEEA